MHQSLDVQHMSQSGFVLHATLEHHVYLQLEMLAGQHQEPIVLLVELLLAFHVQHAPRDITIGLEVSAIPHYNQISQIVSQVISTGHFALFVLVDISFKQLEVVQLLLAEIIALIVHLQQLVQFVILHML